MNERTKLVYRFKKKERNVYGIVGENLNGWDHLGDHDADSVKISSWILEN